GGARGIRRARRTPSPPRRSAARPAPTDRASRTARRSRRARASRRGTVRAPRARARLSCSLGRPSRTIMSAVSADSNAERALPPGMRAGLFPFQVRDRFPARARGTLALSLVAPVFDEEANVERLHARVVEVFGAANDWELVLVDDGSRDRSPE